jgi:hypothetical protein
MRRIALLFVIAVIAAACGGSAGGADPDRYCEIVAELDKAPSPAEMAPAAAVDAM